MDSVAVQQQYEVLNALIGAAHSCGMKLKPDAEVSLLAALTAKGVTATVDSTGLVLKQGTTEISLSGAFRTLRAEREDWFVWDPKHAAPDQITCRADFRGTPQEILQKKARWISEHPAGAYEQLPADRAEAQRRATVPSATMTRAEYQCLSLRDKATLCAAIGAAGIQKIMARTR
jgi:hypothetical protein